MKYNLSEIMKTAHSFRKASRLTMSEALRSAWARAKNLMAMEARSNAKSAA